MAPRKTTTVITANRLSDGEVVYLAADLSWVESLDAARVIGVEEDIAPLLDKGQADVAARLVVDVYPFPVATEDGTVKAVSAREIIRALGPTVRRDLGKQAEDA